MGMFGNLRGQLYLSRAITQSGCLQDFSCVLRTMPILIFAYITTPTIFRFILSAVFVSLETMLVALVSANL